MEINLNQKDIDYEPLKNDAHELFLQVEYG